MTRGFQRTGGFPARTGGGKPSDEMPSLEELESDPHPHLARLRATAPVAYVPALGGWLVTSRAAAVSVLQDPATFTVDDPRFSTAQVVGRSMLSTDGDEHTRHRTPFVAAYRRRRVEADLGPTIRSLTEGLLARIEARPGRAELRADLAGPLAAAAMAAAFGLDEQDDELIGRLLGWYRDIVDSVAGVAAGRPVTERGAAAMEELRAELTPLLPESVAISNAAVLLFGGIETTEGMILNAVRHVLIDASVRDDVIADRALTPLAVEESLRLEPAAAVVDRYATGDVELAGARISAGDLVVVSLAGANRDPAEFPDPDRFELRRPNLRRQLAFASGSHVCLGMDLARLEATTALAAVLTRLPGVRLDDDAPPPTGLVFRKPARLPVHWKEHASGGA